MKHGTASYEFDPPTLDEMRGRFEALVAGRFPWLAARLDGATVGYAYAGPFRTRPAYRYTIEDSIYLAPDIQGRGVGKLLLAQLLRECEAMGFRQMIAVIGDGGVNTASVRLHAAMGFGMAGQIEGSGFKFGRWCDTVLMQKPLNTGNATLPGA